MSAHPRPPNNTDTKYCSVRFLLPPRPPPQVPLGHPTAVSPPTTLGLPSNSRPLLAMYLRGLLINLLHRLRIRKPDLPVSRWRRRALPLRAVARHRLAMCAHSALRRIRIRIALGRDERG
jgi:hypothetical protein